VYEFSLKYPVLRLLLRPPSSSSSSSSYTYSFCVFLTASRAVAD
jgi:hypothetical protein